MNSEESKISEQRKYFGIFLKEIGFDDTVRSIKDGDPNQCEPDIICEFKDGRTVGYELTETQSEKLRKDISKLSTKESRAYLSTDGIGNIRRIAAQKLKKKYTSRLPVELLIYWDQMSSINFSGAKFELIDQGGFESGPFQKIWLMFVGENTGLIYQRTN